MNFVQDTAASDATKPGTEAIVDVLSRIRLELEEIASRIDRNQAIIARAASPASISDADYVSAMQDADLSAQRIAGIAGFLRAIGEEVMPHWCVDTTTASTGLTLTGLAQAIGTPGFATKTAGTENSGEVDLF